MAWKVWGLPASAKDEPGQVQEQLPSTLAIPGPLFLRFEMIVYTVFAGVFPPAGERWILSICTFGGTICTFGGTPATGVWAADVGGACDDEVVLLQPRQAMARNKGPKENERYKRPRRLSETETKLRLATGISFSGFPVYIHSLPFDPTCSYSNLLATLWPYCIPFVIQPIAGSRPPVGR